MAALALAGVAAPASSNFYNFRRDEAAACFAANQTVTAYYGCSPDQVILVSPSCQPSTSTIYTTIGGVATTTCQTNYITVMVTQTVNNTPTSATGASNSGFATAVASTPSASIPLNSNLASMSNMPSASSSTTLATSTTSPTSSASSASSSLSSQSSSTSTTASSSSSTTSAAPTCTPATAGGAIPQIPAGLDLLNVGPNDAPYSLTLQELLASISFPNDLQCRENLVILFPGTAVPALDTYTSTFIPVFADAGVTNSRRRQLSGANADVMVVSNPSISLGDASTTAEYAAFAIQYAALVLGRKATIIAWSQGNLNTQWALKYWPSTRQNLKNYVGMAPDYDGLVQASFLCDPAQLLTTDLGKLLSDFTTEGGFGQTLESILGIGALPTQPGQYQLYLLALLTGNMPSYMSNNTALTNTTSTNGTALLSQRRALLPGHAVTEEDRLAIENTIRRRALALAARQGAGGNPSPLVQLLAGLAGPLSQALTSLIAQPTSVLQSILANYAGNILNLQVPSVIPSGCLPSVWQQTYFSNFVNTLATDYGNGAGDVAFVPSTTVFSITDEVVQPQGATGFENASGFLKNASNIFIQGNGGCSFVNATLTAGLPTVIGHAGTLFSGMGVETAILAVRTGGRVTPDMLDPVERCRILSSRLTVVQATAQLATLPGALLRVVVGGGDQTLATGFVPAEPAIKAYATRRF